MGPTPHQLRSGAEGECEASSRQILTSETSINCARSSPMRGAINAHKCLHVGIDRKRFHRMAASSPVLCVPLFLSVFSLTWGWSRIYLKPAESPVTRTLTTHNFSSLSLSPTPHTHITPRRLRPARRPGGAGSHGEVSVAPWNGY